MSGDRQGHGNLLFAMAKQWTRAAVESLWLVGVQSSNRWREGNLHRSSRALAQFALYIGRIEQSHIGLVGARELQGFGRQAPSGPSMGTPGPVLRSDAKVCAPGKWAVHDRLG